MLPAWAVWAMFLLRLWLLSRPRYWS